MGIVDDVDQFQTLENCLVDLEEPSQILGRVNTLHDAMQALEERYYRPFDRLCDMILRHADQPVLRDDQSQNIYEYIELLESDLACLSDHDGREAVYGAWFMSLVKRKLPPNLRKYCAELPNTIKAGLEVWEPKVITMMEKLIEVKKHLQDKILVESTGVPKKINVTAASLATVTPSFKYPCVFVPNGCTDQTDHFRDMCGVWTALNVQEKVKMVMERNLCVKCLRLPPHKAELCQSQRVPCKYCGKQHAQGICEINALCKPLVFVGSVADGSATVLPTQVVDVKNASAVSMLYDSGAGATLISDEYAKKNKLPVVARNQCMEFALATGERKRMSTNLYLVQLLDVSGSIVNVEAYGSPQEPALIGENSVAGIGRLFGREEEVLDRVEGSVQLLLGSNYVEHFPRQIAKSGGFVLSETRFGGGLVAAGVRRGEGCRKAALVASLADLKAGESSMLSLDSMGVDFPPSCAGCRKCEECTTKTENLSYIDRQALKVYNDCLTFQTDKQRWVADYPLRQEWQGRLGQLRDNYSQGVAVMRSFEKKLIRSDLLDSVNDVIREGLERKVYRIVGNEEDRRWREAGGVVRYIALTYALKEGETTTPLRVCSNSSLKYNGVSTNDLYLPGPDTVTSLISVLIEFRSNCVAATLDVRKFYNQIDSSEKDQNLRRFLWRWGEDGREPDIFVHSTATFGDVSAGPAATTALGKTAEREKVDFPQASGVVRRTTYIDDILAGERSPEKLEQLVGDIVELCRRGGFETKPPHVSGQDGKTTTLGLVWHKKEDDVSIKFRLNLSEKRRGVHVKPDLDLSRVDSDFPPRVSKREVWRIVQSIYDPLGLVLPYTMSMRSVLRQIALVSPGIGWDEPVSEESRDMLKQLCAQMVDIERFRFPRCAMDRDGEAELLCFGDASETALAAAVYFKSERDGRMRCALAAAKGRAAPAVKTSVPKLELTAAVLVTRLAQVVLRAVPVPADRVFYFTDSSSVIGQIKNATAVPKAFEAVRVSEIRHKTRPDQWLWIPSQYNPADRATRPNCPIEEMDANGPWYSGLNWMNKEKSTWPVKASFEKSNVVTVASVQAQPVTAGVKIDNGIIVKATRSVQFTIKVMSAVLQFVFKCRNLTVTAAELRAVAEEMVASQYQEHAKSRHQNGQLTSIRPMLRQISRYCRREVLVANLRGALCDRLDIPVIDAKSELAVLWARECHELAHEGVSSSVQRMRSKFWTPQGRKLVKSVVSQCHECRRRRKRLEEPMLGDVDKMRIEPERVFQVTHVDLAGPYKVRGFVRGRTSKKVWLIFFVCGATSAAYVDVMADYSSNSVITGIVKFTNLFQAPSKYVSDSGTQFMAIKKWAESQGAEWHIVPPGAQHENGVAERMIGLVKKHVNPVIEKQSLDVLELQMVASTIARIVNTRPIGVLKECDGLEALDILTPAHFIRGPYIRGPPLRIGEVSSLHRRAKAIQELTDELWKKWECQLLPTLTTSGRWSTGRQEVKVGSVVYMQDVNPVRCRWSLGKVTEAEPDRNGQIHRVKIEYINEGGKRKTVEKSTRNICTIVP